MRDKGHSRAVKKSLEYIEKNLTEGVSLREISRHIIFSPQHFYRIFNAAVGSTVAGYIRRRRLAKAASELIYSDKRILDIALEYRFQSQEAFTRAFKKEYRLTPGQYRTYSRELIKGGNTMATDKALQGWTVTGQNSDSYKVSVDQSEVHTGKASALLQSAHSAATGFVTLMQMFSAQAYLGKRLKLTAFVKAENIKDWAGLWMRVDGKGGEMLKFDNMQNRPIKGSSDWNQYQVVLDIPQEAQGIAFGILLSGAGKAWSDEYRFEVVDAKTPTTDESEEDALPLEPVNLNFEL
ncbi:helix-turn-helix transcriptional regulator [Paenibacillus sp. NPDC058177]|uniref:helix-turn-helix transcriptional regulator n=1 Tax=Paenibacillus sp. NPDC058177 TaxID=3346369 RepID=UPI0036D7DD31